MGNPMEENLIDMRLNIRYMRVFDMMSLEEPATWRLVLQRLASSAMLALYAVATVSNVAGMARVWGDFEDFVTATCTTAAILFTGVRYIYFVCRRDDMMRLAATITSFEKKARPLAVAEEHVSIMREASRHARLLTRFFSAVVLLMIVAWTAPAVFSTPAARHDVTSPRPLPFQAAYFFDHERSPLYEAVYCFQVAYAMLIACNVVSYDTATAAFLIHTAGQFQVLLASLRSLQDSAMESLEHARPPGASGTGRGPSDLKRHLRRCLVDCIDHQNAITEYVKELDNIYHPFMLMQFLYSVFIIALSVFLATESSADSGDMLKFLALVLASSSELYLCCRYGDGIMQLSAEVATAAYNIEWYEEDEEFQSMVLMMIMKAQRPVKLTAFHYKDISLETYGALLNSSYTYFALLKELK